MLDGHIPLVGAAIHVKDLQSHLDWILADQRDLEIQDPASGDILDGDWQALVKKARELLEGYTGRLGIHGPWNGLPLLAYDRRVIDLVVMRLKQALEFAAEIGATHMVLHSPFEFYGHPEMAHSWDQYLAKEIEQVHLVLEDVLSWAEQVGCMLVMEVSYDTHPLPLLELVRSFKSNNVQLSLDTGHAVVLQRIGGPPPETWVREGGRLLKHVHLQDTDGLLDRHWPPGKGKLDWSAFFNALNKLDHQPRLLLEISPDKIVQAFRWLSKRGFVR